jgi:hypothetical protein
MTSALEVDEWSAAYPTCTLTPGKTRYPLYRRLGGPQDRSGQMQKISPPTGIQSPDCPARSQSLYWLSYPAHKVTTNRQLKSINYNFTHCFVRVWSFISSTNGNKHSGSVMRTEGYEECLHLGGRKWEEAAENWIRSFIIYPPNQIYW